MAEMDYVLSYLHENPDIGIRFVPQDGTLRGAADASWEVRASTSGWVVYWHGAPLTWGSRKQKSIALSSCESEIVALSEAAKDVIYLRKFTRGLDPSTVSRARRRFCRRTIRPLATYLIIRSTTIDQSI